MLETIKEIKDVAASCNKCSLCQNRKKAIFSSGNEIAEVMFITDYPRDDEELALDFFEGKGGKLLQQALIGLGINKEKIYYTSLVKCNVGNKIIKDEEIKSCIDYLRNQVVIMRPKMVVLMGDVVVNEILGDENTVAVVRGKVVDKKLYTTSMTVYSFTIGISYSLMKLLYGGLIDMFGIKSIFIFSIGVSLFSFVVLNLISKLDIFKNKEEIELA
jgi:DNA polymerase